MTDSPYYPTRDAEADALRAKLAKAEAEIARLRFMLEPKQEADAVGLGLSIARERRLETLYTENQRLRASLAAERADVDEIKERHDDAGECKQYSDQQRPCDFCRRVNARRAAEQGKP